MRPLKTPEACKQPRKSAPILLSRSFSALTDTARRERAAEQDNATKSIGISAIHITRFEVNAPPAIRLGIRHSLPELVPLELMRTATALVVVAQTLEGNVSVIAAVEEFGRHGRLRHEPPHERHGGDRDGAQADEDALVGMESGCVSDAVGQEGSEDTRQTVWDTIRSVSLAAES